MSSSIVTERIGLERDLQGASRPKEARVRGRAVRRSTDVSASPQLCGAVRKLRSGKILPYAPSAPIASKKAKVKKAVPAAMPVENKVKEKRPDLTVGIAIVHAVEDGQACPIVIKKAGYALQEECYIALLPPAPGSNVHTKLGHIAFSWLRNLPTGSYGSETCKGAIYESYGVDASASKLNKIFVTHIENTQMRDAGRKYKGVGTALMQAAVEWGLAHGCEGRTSLLAINNSHGFYYKLGMRSHIDDTEEHDRVIADELTAAKAEKREPNTAQKLREMQHARHAQAIDMYLPQEAIGQMKERIAKQPIF